MDVVHVVEEAVVSGAAAAAKDQAAAAVRSAVESLIDLARRVFRSDPVGRTAVEKLQDEQTPTEEAQVWQEQLRARLTALPEQDLRELLTQAQAVLALTDPRGAAAGRYTVTTGEHSTTVQGDVHLKGQDRAIVGWNIGGVSTYGGPPDPQAPGPSSR